jgi:hypothetical protein
LLSFNVTVNGASPALPLVRSVFWVWALGVTVTESARAAALGETRTIGTPSPIALVARLAPSRRPPERAEFEFERRQLRKSLIASSPALYS